MELRPLHYLEAVLETGTFTAAAARCHVAQPALWIQVRALEAEWGVALFEKTGRRVRPTPAALALRPFVRAMLGQEAATLAEVQRVKTGAGPAVRVGTGYYNVRSFMAAAVARYARAHPGVELPQLISIGTADPYTAVREGSIDLAVGTDPKRFGLEGARLYPVWLAAVGRELGKGPLEVRALEGIPLALLQRQFNSRLMLDAACARAGFVPRVVFEDSHVESLVALAREGLATAVAVNEGFSALPRGLHTTPLLERGKRMQLELWLMWRDEATLLPAARTLRDMLVAVARERDESSRRR
jgi:DNA-binding transcriptional LysR family regulator